MNECLCRRGQTRLRIETSFLALAYLFAPELRWFAKSLRRAPYSRPLSEYLFVQAILLLLELRSGEWSADSYTSSPAVSEKSSQEWIVY
jgi:hypothetical protein